MGLDLHHAGEVPATLGLFLHAILHLPDGVADIADDLNLREIDRVDLSGVVGDVDDFRAADFHEEGRLFDHVMADIDNEVGGFDRAVDIVAGGKRSAAHEPVMTLIHHALAELGGDEGDACLVDELGQHLRRHLAVAARADDEDGRLGVVDFLQRLNDRLVLRHRAANGRFLDRALIGMFVRDVLRQLDMDGAGFFLFRDAIGFADAGGDIVARDAGRGVFRDRLHHLDHVEDLEPALLGFLHRLLAGDHHHRHAAKLRIGRGGGEVGGARAKRRDADAGLAGQSAINGGHHARTLFVARQHKLDFLGVREAFEEIEIFLARDAEDVFAPLFLETFDEQIRCFGHEPPLPAFPGARTPWIVTDPDHLSGKFRFA